MFPTLASIVDEEIMIASNFNYDSSELREINNSMYRLFINLPLNGEQIMIICEDKKNPKWYFRRIPDMSQTEGGYGLKPEIETYIKESVCKTYRKSPSEIRKELTK